MSGYKSMGHYKSRGYVRVCKHVSPVTVNREYPSISVYQRDESLPHGRTGHTPADGFSVIADIKWRSTPVNQHAAYSIIPVGYFPNWVTYTEMIAGPLDTLNKEVKAGTVWERLINVGDARACGGNMYVPLPTSRGV